MLKSLKDENEMIGNLAETAVSAKEEEFLEIISKLKIDLTGEENQNP